MDLTYGGFADEVHSGLSRPSFSRVSGQYPCGAEIANTRQMTLVSAEEMAEVTSTLGLAK